MAASRKSGKSQGGQPDRVENQGEQRPAPQMSKQERQKMRQARRAARAARRM